MVANNPLMGGDTADICSLASGDIIGSTINALE
jgi:hypothetical protein